MAIRKGRRQCEAHRRDGARCRAPAIPGGYVCRVHGGSAPQVRVAARRVWLLERYAAAAAAWRANPGIPGQLTDRQLHLLVRASMAQRDFEEYEARLAAIATFRAEVRRLVAARAV